MRRFSFRQGETDITEGVIWKQLLLFFFPILLGTFFQQLYNTVDAMIVGKWLGKEALAAVGGSTGTIVSLMVGFFVGLSSGATVVISQHWGARRPDDVRSAVHTAAAMALIFGALLTTAGLLLSPALLRLMDTPAEVLPHAVTYIRILFIGMIPSLVYNIGSGVLRAVGDSRRPLFFLMVACLSNIVLDVVLVMGCEMGVAGAALATVLSQTAAAVLVVLSLTRSHSACRLDWRRIGLNAGILRSIIRIGLPAGLQSVMYSVSNVQIQAAVNSFGTNAVAGWTAYGKMDGLYWMTVNAFGVAITTFAGQNYGAGRYDRLRRSVRVCAFMTLGATLALSAILLLLGEPLYRLFTSDPAVVESGLHILRLLVPWYVSYIAIEILSGAMRGAGDTLVPTLMTLFGICLLRAVWLIAVVPRRHTLDMALYSYPITWVLTSTLFILYYFSFRWLGKGRNRRTA